MIDKFFNQSEYGPLSERYSEMMSNLYALTRYCDPEASYHDTFSRFNETTLVHTGKVASGTYTDKKLFYVEALTYVRTYRDAQDHWLGRSRYLSRCRYNYLRAGLVCPARHGFRSSRRGR